MSYRKVQISVALEWARKNDLPKLIDIDSACNPVPWTEQEMIGHLRCRNKIGMVALRAGEVVGFCLYELNKQAIGILNIGVDPDWQRFGVGSLMIVKLINKLSFERRNRMFMDVIEDNLPLQLFLRDMGFNARRVLRGYYGARDAYQMVYRVR